MPTKGQYTDQDLQQAGVSDETQVPAPQGGGIIGGLRSFGQGALKGLANTSMGLNRAFFGEQTPSNPLYMHPSNERSPEEVKARLTPQGTPEKLGFGAEQAGEFMLPTGEAKLPSMLEKIGSSAATSGALNKLHGGSFAGGAAAGAGGAALGAGIRAVAPKMAEASLGINKVDRTFGKTPGEAILNETSGIRPTMVAASGQAKLGQLTPELESKVAAAPGTVSLKPARDVVDQAETTAINQNAQSLFGQLNPMNNFLRERFNTKTLIPQDVSPSDALNLKRGFSKEFLGRWNPETHGDTLSTGRKAYGAIDAELDKAVPEAAGLNQRISSLIPVVHRAESTSREAPAAQMLMRRLAAPTGALVGSTFGAGEGYRHGGVPGAIAGGAFGLAAPSLVSTPEGWMLMGRMANKAGSLKPVVGGALQAARTQRKDTEEPKQ
jgi:hypothetical protein